MLQVKHVTAALRQMQLLQEVVLTQENSAATFQSVLSSVILKLKNRKIEPGGIAHNFNPSTQQGAAGRPLRI